MENQSLPGNRATRWIVDPRWVSRCSSQHIFSVITCVRQLLAQAATALRADNDLSACGHAVHLALAPKSNASYKALGAARAEVRANGAKTPPDYLRDAHYPGAEKLGRGSGYRYAHDEPGGVSDQQLMPEGLEGRRFYEPTGRGHEAELARRLEELRRRLGKG